MNKEYTYIENKVLVSNDKGYHTTRKNTKNIKNILISENMVETIEHRMDEINSSIEQDDSAILKSYYKLGYMIYFFLLLIFTILIDAIITGFGFHDLAFSLEKGVQLLKYFFIFGIPIVGISSIFILRKSNKLKKEISGYKEEYNFLEKQLELEEEKLDTLTLEISDAKNNEEIKTIPVKDSEKIDEINQKQNFYFDMGCNLKEFKLLYQKGMLEQMLREKYNAMVEEIDFAKEYINDETNLKRTRKK